MVEEFKISLKKFNFNLSITLFWFGIFRKDEIIQTFYIKTALLAV